MNYKIITVQGHFVRNQVLVMRTVSTPGIYNNVLIQAIFENGISVTPLTTCKPFKTPALALKYIDSFGIEDAVRFLDSFK